MKNLFLTIILSFNFLFSQAQYVTIPDANFVTFLQANYPSCMSGNQMDTTCLAIVNAGVVNCSNKSISDLDGLQYFDNLFLLNASDNNLTSLPTLNQPTIVNLTLSINPLDSIKANNLPPNLLILNTNHCSSLTSIAPFPLSMTKFYGKQNSNVSLPAFHIGMETIDIENCGLSIVPTIPNTVQNLFIGINPAIGSIPASSLPSSITSLSITNCGLSVMPVLPPNLISLSCGMNAITSISTLPQSLISLHAAFSPNLTQITNLPDSMVSIQANNSNINYVDSFPVYVSNFIDLSDNNLASVPSFPNGIQQIDLGNNNISFVPDLPSTLHTFKMENNNVSCWPVFPNLNAVYLFGNLFTCIPNYVLGMTVWPFLDTMPICNIANSTTNPLSCPTGEGIDGNLFDDDVLDCNFGGSELPIKNTQVQLFDASGSLLETTSSGLSGRYFFSTSNNGTYDVKVDTLNKPFKTSCIYPGADSTVTISAIDSLIEDVNFGFICKPGFDVGVQSMSTDGWIFPGQPHSLNVNAGDISNWHGLSCAAGVSGSISITVNGPVSYIGVPATALIPSISGTTYTYSIADFANVNMYTDFELNLETDTTAQDGDTICVSVNITPLGGDIDPINNTSTFCYHVINSYDPNDKQVYPKTVEPGYDDWLTYTIRFQNTGTAPAFNIRLEDTLSTLLDYETFEVIGYKHANSYNLVNDRLVIYFPNIMLEDSTTNEPESKGYFQYRIKPISGLLEGTEIENKAYIFFDYNDPIITNTAVTSFVIDDLSSDDIDNNDFTVFPNPSSGLFYLKMIENVEVNVIEAYSITGQSIPIGFTQNGNFTEIEILNNAKGLCFINIITDKGTIVKKMMIE